MRLGSSNSRSTGVALSTPRRKTGGIDSLNLPISYTRYVVRKIRRGGRIVDLPLGRGSRNIDFGCGVKPAIPIPWGDIVSPFLHHRLPNITVFALTSLTTLALARLTNAFQLVLRSSLVQSWLLKKIEKM